ncbi:hypothetical protein ACOSQ3_004861 [Xanthoceras sorbifolium]
MGSFLDVILSCKSCLVEKEMELLLVMLWRFWFHHNRVVHGFPLLSVEETVTWSRCFLEEFHAVADVPSVRFAPSIERWRAPSPGWVKLNSDMALDFQGRHLGFGAVIRSSDSLVLASCLSSACGLFSPDIGEALTILRIQLAVDEAFPPCQVTLEIENRSPSNLPFVYQLCTMATRLKQVTTCISFHSCTSCVTMSTKPKKLPVVNLSLDHLISQLSKLSLMILNLSFDQLRSW